MKSLLLMCVLLSAPAALASDPDLSHVAGPEVLAFGEGGAVKMLYDARERPQSVYLDDKVHIVYKGGSEPGIPARKADTAPMAVTYDPQARTFSAPVTLDQGSNDHHDCPVIWADTSKRLHLFYGWHNEEGKHLVSKEPGSIGTSRDDWSVAPPPAPMMSYPWTCRVLGNMQLVFYRTAGHYSSWTYRISGDNGKTWKGPDHDVIDLDLNLGMDTDWSCYTSKALNEDGDVLHIGFVAYDDYKRPRSPEELASGKLDPRREYNPYYKETVFLKYSLYYVKIDLRTHEVTTCGGEVLHTPIDRETANSKCRIWDTDWRGSGIPPAMIVDENGQAGFLYNLSEPDSSKAFGYHYVHFEDGQWQHTRITDSTHKWNSGYLSLADDGDLHAYVITGSGPLVEEGEMDRYGGGEKIEEWQSADRGSTWKRVRDLTPDSSEYPGWRYNNVQPVTHPDGSVVNGMLLFYGWKDPEMAQARAFLLHEDSAD